MANVMRLAYELVVRNGIKNHFCKRNEKNGRKLMKNFLRRHQEISVRNPEGLSLSTARDFTPESVVQSFKSTNPLCTPFCLILQDVTISTKPASLLYSTDTRKY